MSLRLRLLLSLLALTAVGLLIVDAVSYGSLRSHLASGSISRSSRLGARRRWRCSANQAARRCASG